MANFRIMLHTAEGSDIDLIDVVPNAVDPSGYPNAFVIPTSWQWPTEGTLIDTAYPQFSSYRAYLQQKMSNPAATASTQVLNWYKYPNSAAGVLYPRPADAALLPAPTP
jgi:hypothetical protein